MNPPPQEEWFDVVNDRDEVIGRRPRTEVHRLGLLHRAVHVLVFNRRGELFLQRRARTKDRAPGKWDTSAAGHLAPGESYEAAAVREVAEELDVHLDRPPERLFKIAACPATDQEFVWVFRAEAEGPFNLHPEELDGGGWYAPDHVTRWLAARPGDFTSAVPVIWERYLAQRGDGASAADPGR